MKYFIREMHIAPAYDKRHPDPKKNYGIHSAHIYFSVKNEENEGLTFSVATGWMLPGISDSERMAFGVDIHRKIPPYSDSYCQKNCQITGGDCYSDGSGILGDDFLKTLIAEGSEGLFKRMEEQFEIWRKK